MRIITKLIKSLLFATIFFCVSSGCSGYSSYDDKKDNIVVLDSGVKTISSNKLIVNSKDPMLVVGRRSSICFVIKSGADLDLKKSEEVYKVLMRGVVFRVEIFNDKSSIQLSPLEMAWRKNGYLHEGAELSACANLVIYSDEASIGDEYYSFGAISNVDINVYGIYWRSTGRYD